MNKTISAIATASGMGSVGIIRISGSQAYQIGLQITKKDHFKSRFAYYLDIFNSKNQILDKAIVIYFKNPNSFTGEDIIEIQGHGGQFILSQILKETLNLGAVLAEPGEFSKRAFLNGKIDLTQAEATADLISVSFKNASLNALKSLNGEFANIIKNIKDQITHLRMFVESSIDFSEEEIDFLQDKFIKNSLEKIITQINETINVSKQGIKLKNGANLVLVGLPNAGKSSLFNSLSQDERAIVTNIEGTTRDILQEQIIIDGFLFNIFDTAGIRDTEDQIEKIGIEKTKQIIEKADKIILVLDESKDYNINDIWSKFFGSYKMENIIFVHNKIDLTQKESEITQDLDNIHIYISVYKKIGIDLLKKVLIQEAGFNQTNENTFTARQRHLDLLNKSLKIIKEGKQQLENYSAGELLAENLKLASYELGMITGQITNEDLLDKIFSSFCIGK